MDFNKVIMIGRITKDPEFRQTQSGIASCKFDIAVNRPYQKDKEKTADFFTVQCWRNTAEFVSRYFTKGNAILIDGKLQNNNWTDNEGKKHYQTIILAESVNFVESKKSDSKPQTDAPQFDSVPTSGNVQHPAPDISEFEEVLSNDFAPF